MKYLKRNCFILLICLMGILTSCQTTTTSNLPEETLSEITLENIDMKSGTTYTYEKDGFGGKFNIRLNDDGTFSYYEGMLSSYIGRGTWVMEGDIITLTDDPKWSSYHFVNHFKKNGDELIFIAEESTNFLFVKVEDGDIFRE